MKCPVCKITPLTNSPRKHGRAGFVFVSCPSCGIDLQASTMINAEGKRIASKVFGYKGGTNHVSLRLSDAENAMRQKVKAHGYTDREIYLKGLEA